LTRRRIKAAGNGKDSTQKWLRERRYKRQLFETVNEWNVLLGRPEVKWEEWEKSR